jgi:hypothetical protein
MLKIINQLSAYKAKDEIEKNAVTSLIAQVEEQLTELCTFCGGEGHISTECTSKRRIDQQLRKGTLRKMIWGTIKSEAKVQGIESRVEGVKGKIKSSMKKTLSL